MVRMVDESKIQALIDGHTARNRELKNLISSKGVALDDRRLIDLHFWAMNERAAENLATALNQAGYPVTVKSKVEGCDQWNVESQIETSPIAVTAQFFVESLVRLAATHESEFDGWGTSIW